MYWVVMQLVAFVGALLLVVPAAALEIRDYQAARHDRFVERENGRELNPDAYYGAEKFVGVGFATKANDKRQFALVTPEHVLGAKHFSSTSVLRFINEEGVAFDRNMGTKTDVPNGLSGVADLILIKLSAPIPEGSGIVPFPYLNLANENAYKNKDLVVFGKDWRAGYGKIRSIRDYETAEPAAIGKTRCYEFRYTKEVGMGGGDDAYAVTGDSGSPSFVMVDGWPALVGVHLAASDLGPLYNFTLDTFVPHYVEQVNGLLAVEGYQLIPAYPEAVELSLGAEYGELRQGYPGVVELVLENESVEEATNVRVELEFPAGTEPDSVDAVGWVVENPAAGEYFLRRAGLEGETEGVIGLNYAAMPVVAEIPVGVVYRSDGSEEVEENVALGVRETFAGFVAGLAEQGEEDDPDGDGFENLLEYAFGGDPADHSMRAVGGYAIAPELVQEGGGFSYAFARRTDAAERGLSYELEFSENLEVGGWSADLPAGAVVAVGAFEPGVEGFERVVLTLPEGGSGKKFVRVRVGLDE